MKKLVYTIICFKCILQITEGSPYQKYIKLFANLLILCICCTMLFSLVGQIEDSVADADQIYKGIEKQWQDMNVYEDIIQEAYKEAQSFEYQGAYEYGD